MSINVSAGHLAPQGGGFEPQRTFNWIAIIPGLEDVELIKLSIERIQLPRYSTAVIHMRYMNEDVKVAGGASVEQNSIVVRDFVDRPTYKVLDNWMKSVHDPETGKIGFASEYKKQATLQLLDPHGDPVRQIICKGMWPSQCSGTDMDYNTDNQTVKLTLVLQIDRYRMEL